MYNILSDPWVRASLIKGLETPDCQPDGSGLDDGVPLPRKMVKDRKKSDAISLRLDGKTYRSIAAQIGVSHETVRIWTAGVMRQRRPT